MKRLFVGGPRHGEVLDIETDTTAYVALVSTRDPYPFQQFSQVMYYPQCMQWPGHRFTVMCLHSAECAPERVLDALFKAAGLQW